MTESPFFSIITPTYNRQTFLEEMIASVAAQTFQDYEHIIVDDGSTDGTEELIKQLMETHPKIIYIKQENKGRSVARNVGIEAGKGEYVCFLDSDDFWKENHLKVLNEGILARGVLGMYHTGLTWVYDDGRSAQLVQYAARETFVSDTEYVIANQFAPNCVCIHASAFKSDKFNPKLSINEDFELWARISLKHPVFSLPQRTANLRVHDENTSKTVEDYVTPQYQVFQLLLGNLEIRKQLSRKFISDRKKSFRIWFIRLYEKQGVRSKLIRAIVLFLIRYPFDRGNSALIVTLFYNLPGGHLLKSLVAKTKSRGVQ